MRRFLISFLASPVTAFVPWAVEWISRRYKVWMVKPKGGSFTTLAEALRAPKVGSGHTIVLSGNLPAAIGESAVVSKPDLTIVAVGPARHNGPS